jgi:hypothetical protein
MSARRLHSEGHRPGLARCALIRTFRHASHRVRALGSGGVYVFPGDAVETVEIGETHGPGGGPLTSELQEGPRVTRPGRRPDDQRPLVLLARNCPRCVCRAVDGDPAGLYPLGCGLRRATRRSGDDDQCRRDPMLRVPHLPVRLRSSRLVLQPQIVGALCGLL